MRAGSSRVGRPGRAAGGDVAEAAAAGAGVAGDHEGGRAARPALADVRAGGLLADRDQLGGAHERLRADEAARERVLRDDPARQAAAVAELRELGRRGRHEVERLDRAVADQRAPPSRTSGTKPSARAAATSRAGRASGDLLNPESALCDHAVTVADRYAPWPNGPLRSNHPRGARLRAPGHRALRRDAPAALVGGRARGDEFRVFHNNRRAYIDVQGRQRRPHRGRAIPDGEAFILHPGEFVLGSTAERVALPDDLVARLEGKSSLGRLGLLIHSHRRLHRPRLRRHDHARAVQRRAPADLDLPGHGDRADLVPPDDDARRQPLPGQVPGPAGPTASAFHREFERRSRLSGQRRPAGRSQEFAHEAAGEGHQEGPAEGVEPPGAGARDERRRSGPPSVSMTVARAMKHAWMA